MAKTNPYQVKLEAHLEDLNSRHSLTNEDEKLTMKSVADYLCITEKHFLNSYFPGDPAKQEPFPLWIIHQLVLGFNINHKDFLLSDDELNNFKDREKSKNLKRLYISEDQVLNDWSLKTSPIQEFVRLYTPIGANETDFAEKYLNAVIQYIKKAEERLWVYEFLGKGNNVLPEPTLKGYVQAHEEIFSVIEKNIASGKLKDYRRVLVLNDPLAKLPSDFLAAVKDISVPVFQHICNCLSLTDSAAQFYVAPLVRPYHYGIINDEFIVSEYYKYRPNTNNAFPDLLFVEEITTKHVKSLYQVYYEELAFLTSDQRTRLTKTTLVGNVLRAKTITSNKIDQKQVLLRKLRSGEIDASQFNKENMEVGALLNLLPTILEKEGILRSSFPEEF